MAIGFPASAVTTDEATRAPSELVVKWRLPMIKFYKPNPIEQYAKHVERVLAERDPCSIEKGYESYLRDLPTLLDEGREGQIVAYCGNVQAAIASTERKLHRILDRKGFNEPGKLFETRITASDQECHKITF